MIEGAEPADKSLDGCKNQYDRIFQERAFGTLTCQNKIYHIHCLLPDDFKKLLLYFQKIFFRVPLSNHIRCHSSHVLVACAVAVMLRLKICYSQL